MRIDKGRHRQRQRGGGNVAALSARRSALFENISTNRYHCIVVLPASSTHSAAQRQAHICEQHVDVPRTSNSKPTGQLWCFMSNGIVLENERGYTTTLARPRVMSTPCASAHHWTVTSASDRPELSDATYGEVCRYDIYMSTCGEV